MSYYDIYTKYKDIDLGFYFNGISTREIETAVVAERLNLDQLIALISPKAEKHLEEMASKAHDITLRYFGRTIQLYTPIYLSNYCDNQCVYCGFNSSNKVERKRLSLDEVDREAKFISSTGLRHILILTGDSREESPVSYIEDCVKILRKYFNSVSIEIYALTEAEYTELVSRGIDGLTIYQETYDEALYSKMHPRGPKSDYLFRLDAPERGARAGMRGVNIGVLLGLSEWRRDVFFLGLHAKYLQDSFTDVEVGISIPRIRQQIGGFKALYNVNDKDIVQMILALRIFLPRLGISLSTREDANFRDNLVPLGITRMSASSTTIVGGHTIEAYGEDNPSQFEILDRRAVSEIMSMLERKGYQGVLKDWLPV